MELAMFERKPIYRETAKRYQDASKKGKKIILDVFMSVTGLKSRNYGARILRQDGKTLRVGKKTYVKADIVKKGKRPGRKKVYDNEVLTLLICVWEVAHYLCGKRLEIVLNEILDNLLAHRHTQASEETLRKIRQISASSIDRLLKPVRKKLEIKGRKGTKPGTLLKQQIAVRTWADWDENTPGFFPVYRQVGRWIWLHTKAGTVVGTSPTH